MTQQSKSRTVSLEYFNAFVDLIVKLQKEHLWKFLFLRKYITVSIDKEFVEREMEQLGLDLKLFRPVVNQVTNIISAILDNEASLAMPWFVENYGETDEVVEQKFKLVEEKMITEELSRLKKLYEKCVFNYVKSFEWGIEDKYLEPLMGNETYKVGVLNLVIQENNPIASEELHEANVNLTLTLPDVVSLIRDLNVLKTKLEG